MRFARVLRPGGPEYAAVRDTEQGTVLQLLQGVPFGEHELTEQVAPIHEVRLLAPVIPTKVFAVGKNYADHAAEMASEVPTEPLIFSKPPTAVIGPEDAIVLPAVSQEVHHEAELAVVIGGLARGVAPEDAGRHIAGYTCANDVTARDLQRRDGQWTRAKGFDTFCPLGPWIDTDLDPTADVEVCARVNGEVRQRGSTSDLVFGVAELVSYCSQFATLLPGDVLLTGTPAGVGPLVDGDRVEVDIAGIGTLANPVRAQGA